MEGNRKRRLVTHFMEPEADEQQKSQKPSLYGHGCNK